MAIPVGRLHDGPARAPRRAAGPGAAGSSARRDGRGAARRARPGHDRRWSCAGSTPPSSERSSRARPPFWWRARGGPAPRGLRGDRARPQGRRGRGRPEHRSRRAHLHAARHGGADRRLQPARGRRRARRDRRPRRRRAARLFSEGEVRGSSDRYLRNALIAALACAPARRCGTPRGCSRWGRPAASGALRARVADRLLELPAYAELATFFADELPAQLADARATTTAKLDAPANKLARVLNSPAVKRVLLNDSLRIDFDGLIERREVLVVRGALGEVGAGNVAVLMQLLLGMLDAALGRVQDRRAARSDARRRAEDRRGAARDQRGVRRRRSP